MFITLVKFCTSTPNMQLTPKIDKEQNRFVNFDPIKSRVDVLMHETMAATEQITTAEHCSVNSV